MKLSIPFYYIKTGKKSHLNSVNICFQLPLCAHNSSIFLAGTKYLLLFSYLIRKKKLQIELPTLVFIIT